MVIEIIVVINQYKYSCTILFGNFLTKREIKSLIKRYSNFLIQNGATHLEVLIKKDFSLIYSIKNSLEANFIEFSFVISPTALDYYIQKLNLDEAILRFFLIRT